MKVMFFPEVDTVALAAAVETGAPELARIPGEGKEAYETFRRYCLEGRGLSRSQLAKAAGVGVGSVGVWKSRNVWNGRIEAWWAAHEGRGGLALAGAPGVAVRGEKGWEERRADWREREWGHAQRLLKVADAALERWEESDEVPTLAEVARMVELASKLARLAAGMPLEHTEVSGNAASPVRVEFYAALERVYGSKKVVDVEATPMEAD